MKFFQRGPFLIFALVLIWRVLLLVFTVQPIPANDAFGYDGGVVNFLHGGGYCNPSMALVFPISGRQVYSTYPPLYQGALLLWMKCFGTSVISAMALHLALFAISGYLTLGIVRHFFPAGTRYTLVALLLFGVTFDDRPDGLAYVFGLLSLGLVMRQLSDSKVRLGVAAGLMVTLLLGFCTSVIVGAFFWGVGFVACATTCLWRREPRWFGPFGGAACLFAVATCLVAWLEPLWWAGFMESARQQSVLTTGFHHPQAGDIVKLVRTTPVFLLGIAALPLIIIRRKEIFAEKSAWLALAVATFVMGWVLLVLSMVLLAPNYIYFALFPQILLAAGLLALACRFFPRSENCVRGLMMLCALFVSVRAIGMTTWGVACAGENSYQSTQGVLREALVPFAGSDRPVVVSSAYLYSATEWNIKNPVHSDWYFDHANWTNNAQINALARLQPAELVLTQFDYYRSFEGVLGQLRQHPDWVDIEVRNLARIQPPDAIPSLQRVVQHVSWAPVIVELHWKAPPSAKSGISAPPNG